MPTIYPIPEELRGMWGNARQSLVDMLTNALYGPDYRPGQIPANALSMMAPESRNALQGQQPANVADIMAALAMERTPEEGLVSGISGLPGPLVVSPNYRTAEAIQELRRLMAAENKARGVIKTRNKYERTVTGNEFKDYDDFFNFYVNKAGFPPKDIPRYWNAYLSENVPQVTDPLDQILRGSWFHGMRPEARNTIAERGGLNDWYGDLILPENAKYQWEKFRGIGAGINPELNLLNANALGLPGSTHAHPGYVRFGEPYGVSITASPSIAQKFSADDYIHRVMPLYEGPPTERIIPLWRPEGAQAMNEGYNRALNEWLLTEPGRFGRNIEPYGNYPDKLSELVKGIEVYLNTKNPSAKEAVLDFFNASTSEGKSAEQFNRLYSKALQDMGYRGILYSPTRYNEYEMLMLDPSFVKPLDYRKLADYAAPYYPKNKKMPDWQKELMIAQNISKGGDKLISPNALTGYTAEDFTQGPTRLSEVFSQQSWPERLSPKTKEQILSMIPEKYRSRVATELYGGK